MKKPTRWVAVPSLAVIEINGEKASQFLQGQFTCDIRLLESQQAIFTACCDHKGRMLVNGWLARWQEKYLFFLTKEMVNIAISHLQKFAVFSKVSLQKTTAWQMLNFIGPLTESLATGLIYSSVPFHTVMGSKTDIQKLKNFLIEQNFSEVNPELIWIMNQLVLIKPATSLQFIPQMIGLEKLGGVSVTKGCYVGQEVIARTHHLGQLKRHLHLLQLQETSAMTQVGDSVFNSQKEIVGQVAELTPSPEGGHLLLAVIQDRAAQSPLFNAQDQSLILLDH